MYWSSSSFNANLLSRSDAINTRGHVKLSRKMLTAMQTGEPVTAHRSLSEHYAMHAIVAELAWSLETRRNNISRSFFQEFANQTLVFTILSHLREIPLSPPGWDLPLPLQDPFSAPKILFIYKFWPTSLPINRVTPSYFTSHISPAAQHMHIVRFALFACYCYCCFYLLFQLLYYAIRPPGRKDVNKLTDCIYTVTLTHSLLRLTSWGS